MALIGLPLHAIAQVADSRTNANSLPQSKQLNSVPNSLKQWSSGQWTFVTDLPIDDEVKAWPNILDQALLQWCKKWNIPIDTAKQWPLTIHWIGDRNAFEQAGLLEGTLPFDDGFQLADKIFLLEQPSLYYRRHLLLHEATHWVMYRAFGGAGSPWFMEGMAEVEGTHELNQGKLQLAVIPTDPLTVPHWGRFNRLRSSVENGKTPSMKQILRFGNQREDRMDRYVWSWAACVFFRNHPRYSQAFSLAAAPPLDYSDTVSKRLESSLQNQWDFVEADWSLFAQDFNFGFDPTKHIFETESLTSMPPSSQPMLVDSKRSWQGRAGEVKKGTRLTIRASGQYVIATPNGSSTDPRSTNTRQVKLPWRSSAEGVTIEYHQHFPLGKLIACFIPNPQSAKPKDIVGNNEATNNALARTPMVFPVGQQAEFTPPSDGWILFKINEPVADLIDNSGALTVEITSSTP